MSANSRVTRYQSSPPSFQLPSAPPPTPHREIIFSLSGHPPGKGVPLSYLLSLDSTAALNLAGTPELERACERVLPDSEDGGQMIVRILCPVYEDIRDEEETFSLPLSLDPVPVSSATSAAATATHRTTRAALGKRAAEAYQTFLTQTAHDRLLSAVPTDPAQKAPVKGRTTGPFGERVEQFSLVKLRFMCKDIWEMHIVMNGV